MGKIFIRHGFSDRNGTGPKGSELQIEDFSKETRVDFVNCLTGYLAQSHRNFFLMYGNANWEDQIAVPLANKIEKMVFHEILPVGKNFNFENTMDRITEVITSYDYDDVLSILEFTARTAEELADHREYYQYNSAPRSVISRLNDVFEEDNVGYRFVDDQITRITDKNQIKSIENAISLGTNPSEHLSKALLFISEKGKKDYENSIKESITAVEAQCDLIVGRQATLGEALTKLETAGISIHPALKEAFSKLYGYTSDAKGVRHAGNLDSEDATFEEAEYMLVSCSAFVSYLVAISKRK